MIFDPARDPGDCGDAWNMWEGWQIEPKPGDWTKFGEHLRRNICANDQALETMVTDLLSYWFQHPERQGEVALAMRGDQGTGKGIFANAILKLWGAHGLYIAHGGHLTGNFNNHLMNCCCLFADEAVFAGDHKAVNILKSLVTEPFIAIESKGVDVAPAINRLKIILATNEPRVIRAGREERRYQILEVGDDMKQNAAYFGAIVAELKAGGYAALLHDLLARDIGDRPPTVITTAGLMNQQTQSLEPIQAWWLGCLEVGEFLGCYYWPEKGMREQVGWFDHPTGTELHEGFKDWCKSENVRPPAGSAQTFSTQINKMLDGNRPKRLHGNRKEFPPLEQCREWFLLYQNWPDRDWEETPDEMC